MDSSTQTSADDTNETCVCSELFNLAEKLRIELQKKDEELLVKDEKLAKEEQEKQELSARANRAETELASAQEMIDDLQLSLWKSFPSNSCSYLIQVNVSSEEPDSLLVDEHYHVRAQDIYTDESKFRFTKNSNGTFLIYSIAKGKYLQTNSLYTRVEFTANDEDSAEEFVLFLQLRSQNQQAGLLVNIGTLAGYFLSMKDNYVVVNSRYNNQPEKFLIVTADKDDY